MNNFLQVLRNLGPARLASMGAVFVGIIAFLLFIISRLSSPSYDMLYGDLDLSESSKIVARLDSLKIDYELKSDGAQIFVPREHVTKLRITLAEDGLPTGGSIGNEIFDKGEGLGTSSFMQNINRVRALEGELSRTVAAIEDVKSARVHLVLPQRELFSRDTLEASASIVLKMKGAGRLDRNQIGAIQHLVASAVPGLSPNQVSIIDDRGTLLARGMANGAGTNLLATQSEEQRQEVEVRLAQRVEELLEKTVGMGGVRARVSVEMDFNRVKTNSETYDPNGQVVRSTQTVDEKSGSNETSSNPAVSVQENLPEIVGQNNTGAGAGASKNESRTEETVNYEISRTVKEEVRETGEIRKVSVAVLVDGRYKTDEAGKDVYEPRSDEELKKLEALVKTAIGYDADRDDSVEVVNMQFVHEAESAPEVTKIMGLDQEYLSHIVEMIVMGIVGILALLLVVRPIVNRLFEGLGGAVPAFGDSEMAQQLAGGGQYPALAGPQGAQIAGGGAMAQGQLPSPAGVAGAGGSLLSGSNAALLEPTGPSEIEEMINIRQIEGKIKASSIKRVGEIIEKHPDQAASVIRTWLYQDSGAQG